MFKNNYKNYIFMRLLDSLIEVSKSVIILAIVLGMLFFAFYRVSGFNPFGR